VVAENDCPEAFILLIAEHFTYRSRPIYLNEMVSGVPPQVMILLLTVLCDGFLRALNLKNGSLGIDQCPFDTADHPVMERSRLPMQS
jgi:hypothetical protein